MTEIHGEIWKDIPKLEGIYAISNYGRIWSYAKTRGRFVQPGRLLRVHTSSKGYLYMSVIVIGWPRLLAIHRAIALAFIPNPNNYPQINHKNGIKNDNRIENLEWCTSSQNISHAFQNGLIKISEHQRKIASIQGKKTRKISFEQAEYIRSLYPELGATEISRKLLISRRIIWNITHNRSHLEA